MSDLIFLNKIPKISSKIYRIVNKYKDLLIKDDNKRDKQVLSKLIEDYYEYVYELLFFLCRVKNGKFLKYECLNFFFFFFFKFWNKKVLFIYINNSYIIIIIINTIVDTIFQ